MKTGVIGLGAMGSKLALNFHKAGKLHRIWNRTLQKSEVIASKTGVQISDSPAQLASDCELIIICVSRDEDLLEIVTNIAQTILAEDIVCDISTVSSDTAKKATTILQACGAHFLDCPVSGGVEGAKQGTLAMMVGGDESILDRARPILQYIASNIIYMGVSGSGQATKAVNQLMGAGINQAVTEALAFAQAMNLDTDRVIDIISSGASANWFLTHRGKTMLAGSFESGFKLSLHHKDIQICQNMLRGKYDTSLPIIEMTLIHYQRLIEQGYGDEDISALYRLKKEQFEKSRIADSP